MPYPADLDLRAATISLLGRAWPRLPGCIERARGWGVDWCDWSEPFVRIEDGLVLAHVGVMEIPVLLDGREEILAGVHAVCTHPDHRGRGHLRAAMEAALHFVDARFERAVLWANDKQIYHRFGFREQPESVFVGALASGPALRGRRLSLDDPGDRALFREALAQRAPVSDRWASRGADWLALINLSIWPGEIVVAALTDPRCVVIFAIGGGTLRLYDVVAPAMPTLANIAGALGPGFARVEVCFVPDGLGDHGLRAEPLAPDDDVFMVRGPAIPGEGLALSPLAHT